MAPAYTAPTKVQTRSGDLTYVVERILNQPADGLLHRCLEHCLYASPQELLEMQPDDIKDLHFFEVRRPFQA